MHQRDLCDHENRLLSKNHNEYLHFPGHIIFSKNTFEDTNTVGQHNITVTLSLNFGELWKKRGSVSARGDDHNSRLISYHALPISR